MARTYFNLIGFLVVAWLASATDARAQTNEPPHTYPNGFRQIREFGNELYEQLDEVCQKGLQPDPVALEDTNAPVIVPVLTDQGTGPVGQVVISPGFIDLLNYVAHAKAIDEIQPGYFQRYASLLGRGTPDDSLPEPEAADPRFWSDNVMSEQKSYFNQMVGMTVALNLSHVYLGHNRKYARQMPADKLAPINTYLSPKEWNDSLTDAMLNSGRCSLMAEGSLALFEAIDKMPKRPAWAAYLVPPWADLKKLNKQLADYQAKFLKDKLELVAPAK